MNQPAPENEKPFLPEMAPDPSKPDPNQRPAHSPKRTLALWVALIVMFIGIYTFFSETPRGSGPPLPRCEPDYTTMVTAVGSLLFVFGGLIAWFVSQFKKTNQFNREQEEASVALVDGQWQVAAAQFGALMEKYRGHGGRLVAAYQRAWAKLRDHDLEGALTDAIESDKSAGLFTKPMRTRGAVLIGHLYALRGDSDTATRWLDDARLRIAGLTGDRLYSAALLSVADATLLCRQEKYAEALALLDRDQQKIESLLQVTAAVEAWVLRAFAMQHVESARSVGTLEPVLALLRARRRGSFDYLAVAWPALRDFLVEHALASADPAPSDRGSVRA